MANFNLKKLANGLDKLTADNLNVLGNNVNKAIQDGLDKGHKLNGDTHTPLKKSTLNKRQQQGYPSGPPLVRSGNMRKTKKKAATPNNQVFEIQMTGKSKRTGAYYGAYHNEGYTNSPKSAYPAKKVPKREWFGIPKSAKPGGKQMKKTITEMRRRVRTAFKTNFHSVGQYKA